LDEEDDSDGEGGRAAIGRRIEGFAVVWSGGGGRRMVGVVR